MVGRIFRFFLGGILVVGLLCSEVVAVEFPTTGFVGEVGPSPPLNSPENFPQEASADTPTPPRDVPLPSAPAEAQANGSEANEVADGKPTGPAERLAELQKEIEAIRSEWDDFQADLTEESKEKSKRPSTKIGGRVHLDYWDFTESDPGINFIENDDANFDPQNRWLFRRIRLEMAGTVPQNMFWRMQIDFNNPQTPEIKDVYLGWSGLPNNHRLILGNQKRPLGLDHLNSSRFNVFIERPLTVETFNEDARRFGLAMYGHTDDESLAWTYGVYNLENIATDGRFIGDDLQAGLYGRLFGSPWYDKTSGGRGYWHMAIAGAVADPDGDGEFDLDDNRNEARFRTRPLARSDQRWLNTTRIPGADRYEVLAFESMLNIGAFQLTSEYFFTTLQRSNTTPIRAGGPFDATLDSDLFFHGGYVYASYFLTGEHMPYNRTGGVLRRVKPFENFFLVDRCNGQRGSGWGAWQVGLRYDHLDLTDGGVNGGVGDMLTVGLNWYWTAYSKVQNNVIFGTIDQSGLAGPDHDGGDFVIMGSRFMIDF